MKKYTSFLLILLLTSSCTGSSTQNTSNSNNVAKIAKKEISDNKFTFDKYIDNFIGSRREYNNNSITRSEFMNEFKDSLVMLRGDTLYNISLKFNDLGGRIDDVMSANFSYSHTLFDNNRIEGLFYAEVETSIVRKLIEKSRYSVNAVFKGFSNKSIISRGDHYNYYPVIYEGGKINLGALPIEIISITKEGATK